MLTLSCINTSMFHTSTLLKLKQIMHFMRTAPPPPLIYNPLPRLAWEGFEFQSYTPQTNLDNPHQASQSTWSLIVCFHRLLQDPDGRIKIMVTLINSKTLIALIDNRHSQISKGSTFKCKIISQPFGYTFGEGYNSIGYSQWCKINLINN